MAAYVVNVEAGKRICKVCITEKKKKSYAVTDSFIFTTPDGTVVDGAIMDPIVLGEKLKAELRNRGIGPSNCVFSLNSSKAASRDVDLPVAKDDQIKNVISTNASEYFPVDITKYVVSHSVLSRTKTESHCMVVAVPQLIVEGYTNLAEVAGLTCEAIDYAVNSQFQVLRGVSGEGVTMYVNVDPDSTQVTFIENGELLLQRSIMMGGDEMICSYMALNNMADEEYANALEALCAEELPEGTPDFSDSLARVSGGASRALDFFRTGKHAEKEIGKIVLMGSCARLNGLKDRIADTIGIETVFLEDVPELAGLANSTNGISYYINCLGARLAPLSFLPQEYLDKTGQGKKKSAGADNFGYIVLGASVVISLALIASCLIPYLLNKKELESVESEITEYAYCEEKYNEYVLYTNGEANLEAFTDLSQKNNTNLLAFFNELEAKLPKSLNTLSASCTEDSVSLSLTCPSFKEAAETLRQLRSFKTIDIISCSGISGASSDDGSGIATFSVVCSYIVPEPETEPAPAETAEAEVEE